MEIPASLLMSSGMHVYVCVTGCLQADGANVFGLNKEEEEALTKRYNTKVDVPNGILLKCPVMNIINALSELGYKVISTTGTVDCNNHTCSIGPTSSLHQSLDELEFERGIWYAAQTGDILRVKKLLDDGKHVDMLDGAGYTALHYAARNGHLAICETLIKHNASINAVTRSGNATSLHRACSAGHVNIVKLLLANKADCTVKDADGKTALHRAAEKQSLEICNIILSACSSLKNEIDNKGKTAADYAQNPQLLSLLTP